MYSLFQWSIVKCGYMYILHEAKETESSLVIRIPQTPPILIIVDIQTPPILIIIDIVND